MASSSLWLSSSSIPEDSEELKAQKHEEIRNATMKRFIKVVEPELADGPIEYKRQVNQSSAARLRSLKTQMSFRLDQGNGTCRYRVGVEDDGCHSLLDYESVAKSCRVLEYIARSLNAVVLERVMIQNEVALTNEGEYVKLEDTDAILRIREPSVLGDAMGNKHKISLQDAERIQTGGHTRAELVIQKIETHELDPPPVPLAELDETPGLNLYMANGNTSAAPAAGAVAAETSVQAVDGATGTTAHDDGTHVSPNGKKPNVGETMSARNIRVAVVGNVDAGKSTLIGTLTTSCLDDGRGRSRTAIMKHRHEIESGRTSTATTHLMGFHSSGEAITGRDQIRANKRKGEDEIAREAYRIITLMDLAGHEKYLKTTIHGVSSGFADYALILVNSRQPPTHMTLHHLNLCCSFGIPVIVVYTKVDGCPEHAFKSCKEDVSKMLRSPEVRKRPFAVRNENDVATVMDKLRDLAPLIETSCVTGQGIELLKKMLFSLPKRRKHENKLKRSFEFLVEDIFNVPGVGAVVSGFVNAGELTVGPNCNVYVGPTDDGSFMRTVAKSAHIARINTPHITSGQSACLAFALNKDMRKKLRRGMVVLMENPTSTRQFDAEICVLKGEGTTIRRSYQAYVHILNVRQSAIAKSIEIVESSGPTAGLSLDPIHGSSASENDGIVLRPGSRAKVRFEFAQRPEYVRPGMRMLFRDGRVRGVGIITSIPPHTPAPVLVK